MDDHFKTGKLNNLFSSYNFDSFFYKLMDKWQYCNAHKSGIIFLSYYLKKREIIHSNGRIGALLTISYPKRPRSSPGISPKLPPFFGLIKIYHGTTPLLSSLKVLSVPSLFYPKSAMALLTGLGLGTCPFSSPSRLSFSPISSQRQSLNATSFGFSSFVASSSYVSVSAPSTPFPGHHSLSLLFLSSHPLLFLFLFPILKIDVIVFCGSDMWKRG